MESPDVPPDQLFQELYRDLKTLAGRHVRKFDGNVSLSPTALVHEAWLQFGHRADARFPDRDSFLAYASRAMRGIIIDYARQRGARKRGGDFHFTGITGADVAAPERDELDLERLGEALDALSATDPRLAEVVDLHFFCGLSFEDIAVQRGVSERTVFRDWRKARLYLGEAMGGEDVS